MGAVARDPRSQAGRCVSASVFDHPWLSELFAAPEIAALWSAEAQLAHLLDFERAYTRALATVERIGFDEEAAALAAIDACQPDIAALAAGTARDGVVVPELVRQLRLGSGASEAIHTGATSQDVIDTALVLTLRNATNRVNRGLEAAVVTLSDLEDRFGGAEIMGRTRMQAALPMRAATRLQAWRRPLESHLEHLGDLAPRVFRLQLGGAVGDNQALGGDADAVVEEVGHDLGLYFSEGPWHSDRSGISEFGTWLALVTGSLGKIGQDVCLMAQQGIDEITIVGGGGSSAMPHKSNPVQAELLVTLARFTAGQAGVLNQALVHEQERSGAAWALEWMVLPQMTMAAGCALRTAHDLLSGITRIGEAPTG